MTAELLDQLLERSCGSPEYAALVVALNMHERNPDAIHARMVGECLIDCIQITNTSSTTR